MKKNTDQEIIQYVDSIITCERNISNNQNKSIELQLHKHSKSCTKRINNVKKM